MKMTLMVSLAEPLLRTPAETVTLLPLVTLVGAEIDVISASRVTGAETVMVRDLALLPALLSFASVALTVTVWLPIAVEEVVTQLKLTVALAPAARLTLVEPLAPPGDSLNVTFTVAVAAPLLRTLADTVAVPLWVTPAGAEMETVSASMSAGSGAGSVGVLPRYMETSISGSFEPSRSPPQTELLPVAMSPVRTWAGDEPGLAIR